MNTFKSWYVVYTKHNMEKKVAETLNKKKLQVYCPTCNQMRVFHGKIKIDKTSLFPNVLFVLASESDHKQIRETDGVSGFLFWLQQPAVIDETELEALQLFLSIESEVRVEKVQVQIKDQSNLRSQNLKVNYNMNEIDGLKKLYLPSLGYAVIAEEKIEQIKSVA